MSIGFERIYRMNLKNDAERKLRQRADKGFDLSKCTNLLPYYPVFKKKMKMFHKKLMESGNNLLTVFEFYDNMHMAIFNSLGRL